MKIKITYRSRTGSEQEQIADFVETHSVKTIEENGRSWTVEIEDDTQAVYDFLDSSTWIESYSVL